MKARQSTCTHPPTLALRGKVILKLFLSQEGWVGDQFLDQIYFSTNLSNQTPTHSKPLWDVTQGLFDPNLTHNAKQLKPAPSARVCVSPRPIQLLEDARGQLPPLGPRAALHGGFDMKIVSRCAVVAFKWFLQAAPLWRPVCQMTAAMGRGTYRPHPGEASAARLPPGRCLAEGHCGLCRNIRIIGYFMGTVC